MASDVSQTDPKLPPAWKARLSDHQMLPRKIMAPQSPPQPLEMPSKIVIEPTTPANDDGLPAFKIKQQIEPQPTYTNVPQAPKLRDMRVGVLVAGAIVAIGAFVLVQFLIGA